MRKLWQRPQLLKVVKNTGWLFGHHILRMSVGLFVGVWLARYLGPDQFGIWNFALALSGMFAFMTGLGLDQIVIRNLVNEPEKKDELLGTAFVTKLLGAFVALPIMMFVVVILRPDDRLTATLVLLSALGFIFQSFNTIDFFFQAQIQSKYSVYAMDASFSLLTMIKVGLLLSEAPLLAFGIAGLLESILTALFLVVVYKFNRQILFAWRFSKSVFLSFMKDCWPLALSSAAIMVYMKIDQIMIGEMLGNTDLGIYSAAARISEAWFFVPMAIVSSAFPAILERRQQNDTEYLIQLKRLMDLMALLGISVALVFSFAGQFIINMLYGALYRAAGTVLIIHCWCGVFVCIGVVSSMWLVAENLQRYSFYRTLLGASINIFLNVLLIPILGCYGAAFATVVSYGIATYSIILFEDGKIIRPMMLASMLPYRWFFVRAA